MSCRRIAAASLAFALLLTLAWRNAAPAARTAAQDKPFIVVFNFQSKFDHGKWGKWAARNFRKKAVRKRKYQILDELQFEEVMGDMNFKYDFEDPIEKFVKTGVEGFQAQIIVWGKVEQTGASSYKLFIRAMDLRKDKTKLIVDDVHDCPNPHYITLGVRASLDKLEGILSGPKAEEVDDESWRQRPNLVKNGGFEKGSKWHPVGWEKPNGLCQFIVTGVSPNGRCLKLETNVLEDQHREWMEKFAKGAPATQAPKPLPTRAPYYDTVGGLGGSHLYSDPIYVKPGMTYRFDIDCMGPKGNCKLFIKGYALIRDKETYGDQEREIYRAPGTLGHVMEGAGKWVHWSRKLHPTDAWAVFDFESDFDNGKVGRKVADAIRKLATGTGRFAVVDGKLLREKVAEKNLPLEFNMLTDQIVEFTSRELGAMIAVWGAVIVEKGRIKLLARAANVRKKQIRPYFDREFEVDDINKLPLACAKVVEGMDRGTPVVKYLRIKLDAYWPQGTYYFDNVTLTEEGMYDSVDRMQD